MFGIKNESLICKLRRPETKIGRHTSNHVILSKSRKVSRFHAIIEFLNDTLLIKDISEWGVYVNNLRICKHRWTELKAGDKIALGALTTEDDGCMLEVVVWEPEDKYSRCADRQIEVIDITEDNEDEMIIEISDDECKISNETATSAAKTPLIFDVEDETDFSRQFSEIEKDVIPNLPTEVLLPPFNQPAISSNKTEFDFLAEVEVPRKDSAIISSKEIERKFIDVTSSMNGLLKQPPSMLPTALQSILDYSSDEENYTFFNDRTTLNVNYDIKYDNKDVEDNNKLTAHAEENMRKGWLNTVKRDVFKRWSEPYKQYNHDGFKSPPSENSIKLSGDSSPSASDETKKAPIMHKTLLTSKIAKIAVISPLPNKRIANKRKKRIRSESPDTIYQRLEDTEQTQKSTPRKKNYPCDSNSQKSSTSALIAVTIKQAREKVKTLYPVPPIEVHKTSKTRAQPKVKITEKNRGDFLTKAELVPVHRSPVKPAIVRMNDDIILDEPMTKLVNTLNRSTTSNSTPKEMVKSKANANTCKEHVKSMDEILDEIEICTVAMNDYVNEMVPNITSARTVEVEVDFAKVPPLKHPAESSYLKQIRGSIFKKSSNKAHFSSEENLRHVEKNIGSFSREIRPSYADDKSRFSTMVKNVWPTAECHNCGENGHYTKHCMKEPVCYTCSRVGHTATNCTRTMDPAFLKSVKRNLYR